MLAKISTKNTKKILKTKKMSSISISRASINLLAKDSNQELTICATSLPL